MIGKTKGIYDFITPLQLKVRDRLQAANKLTQMGGVIIH